MEIYIISWRENKEKSLRGAGKQTATTTQPPDETKHEKNNPQLIRKMFKGLGLNRL